MKDYELTLQVMLERATDLFGYKEIVSELPDGTTHRYTYDDAYDRISQLANALDELGVDVQARDLIPWAQPTRASHTSRSAQARRKPRHQRPLHP